MRGDLLTSENLNFPPFLTPEELFLAYPTPEELLLSTFPTQPADPMELDQWGLQWGL